MKVECCYCAEVQDVPRPPDLVDCKRCGRSFRIFWNYSGVKVELGEAAKKFFELKGKT